MMSSIGRFDGGTPSMQAMQALQKQAFNKADASGNGSLDIDEFKGLMTQAPGGKAPPGAGDAAALFKSTDADGDGELTGTELQSGMERAMQSFRSTVSMGGGASPAGDAAQDGEDDTWKVLLDSIQRSAQNNSAQAAQRAYGSTVSAGLSLQA